jgi:hypothetical protein
MKFFEPMQNQRPKSCRSRVTQKMRMTVLRIPLSTCSSTLQAGGEEDTARDCARKVEPEDDFSATWEVLDLAREVYEKQMDRDDQSARHIHLAG